MVKKKDETKEIIEKIYDYTLEDIMGERFGSYSKYIIQDRAIPDARDGLKPVQRFYIQCIKNIILLINHTEKVLKQ